MSWAAHQFEVYAVEAHLPKKMVGQISWFAIFFGDFTPDFLAKFWVYGFNYNGHHYGASKPYQWHRGWPGMGISHTLFFGALCCLGIWAWKHNRAWTIGFLLGFAAHVLTDVNDSIGTMLLFPFSTLNWSLHTWAYAATVKGGKYLDAAAYFSSLGFMMDLFWFFVVLGSWKVLTQRVLAHEGRARRSPRVVVARPVARRAGAARAVPRRVLLRRLPHDRVDDLGARRGPAGHQRRETQRIPVGPVVDRARGGSSTSRCRRSRRGSCSRWR